MNLGLTKRSEQAELDITGVRMRVEIVQQSTASPIWRSATMIGSSSCNLNSEALSAGRPVSHVSHILPLSVSERRLQYHYELVTRISSSRPSGLRIFVEFVRYQLRRPLCKVTILLDQDQNA
jgi:hypothetical protein